MTPENSVAQRIRRQRVEYMAKHFDAPEFVTVTPDEFVVLRHEIDFMYQGDPLAGNPWKIYGLDILIADGPVGRYSR